MAKKMRRCGLTKKQALQAVAAVVSDKGFQKSLKRSLDDVKKGRLLAFDAVKELGNPKIQKQLNKNLRALRDGKGESIDPNSL